MRRSRRCFPACPMIAFIEHRWRDPLAHLGEVPSEFIENVSEGQLRFPIPGRSTNACSKPVGTGSSPSVSSCPMRFPGSPTTARTSSSGWAAPMRSTRLISSPRSTAGRESWGASSRRSGTYSITCRNISFAACRSRYVMTVRDHDEAGGLVTRGIYACDGYDSFPEAARLCQRLNITFLDEPLQKGRRLPGPPRIQVHMGRKQGHLSHLPGAGRGRRIARSWLPGVVEFGEDPAIDSLIRTYGYRGKKKVLDAVERHEDLRSNLGAAAALINGSSDDRFAITYCTDDRGGGKGLTSREIESVGYRFAALAAMLRAVQSRCDAGRLQYHERRRGGVLHLESRPWTLGAPVAVSRLRPRRTDFRPSRPLPGPSPPARQSAFQEMRLAVAVRL